MQWIDLIVVHRQLGVLPQSSYNCYGVCW